MTLLLAAILSQTPLKPLWRTTSCSWENSMHFDYLSNNKAYRGMSSKSRLKKRRLHPASVINIVSCASRSCFDLCTRKINENISARLHVGIAKDRAGSLQGTRNNDARTWRKEAKRWQKASPFPPRFDSFLFRFPKVLTLRKRSVTSIDCVNLVHEPSNLRNMWQR